MQKIKQRLKEMFSLDYRSLALLRIGMGLLIVLDAIQRLEDLKVFYTDTGVIPRTTILNLWGGAWNFSFHMMFGTWQLELILFIISIIAGLMLIVGYRTLLATIVSWVLLISVHNRAPLILQGGDVIFRVVLFWCMFLPLGKYFSVDYLRTQKKLLSKNIISPATVAYILQIVMFYFFSGYSKTGAEWVRSGTAIYYALSIDQLTTAFGHFLLKFPRAMKALTFSTVYLEMYGTFGLISPIWNGPIRTIIVFIFAIFQIGINMSMHLGLFGAISIFITFGLLPSWFWENCYQRIREWARMRSKKTLTIYYDADCGFCTKTMWLIARKLWLPRGVAILEAQSDEKINEEMMREDSFIAITSDGMHHYRADALRHIISTSPLFSSSAIIFKIPGVLELTDYFYKNVAKNRLKICVKPKPEKSSKKDLGVIEGLFVSIMLVLALSWNIQTLPNHQYIVPSELSPLVDITRIDQKFDMFAPYPLLDDGWYVIPGVLGNGKNVDLFRDGAQIMYEKPSDVSALYKNQRWQKYMMNLWSSDYEAYRLPYGQYLCRSWNSTHEGSEQLQTFQIIFNRETTLPNYEQPEIVPITIWDHHCF
jgi:predicted DCC family thiol-disulfide oxidoreductase YuxK